MRVSSLGHAGLKVETPGSTLLVDPWMSPYGAYQASWFQYPDNSHLLATPGLFSPSAVIISHEHLDHLDPWFLARLDADVPVIVPQYPSPVMRQKLESARPDGPVTVVRPGDWLELAPQVRVLFVAEDSPMNHDAAVVVQAADHVLIDLNDARLSPAQLRAIRRRTGERVDALALQCAGASWYPMCYGYGDELKQQLSGEKRLAKLQYSLRAVRAAEPTVVLPFAGPPCFLDPALFPHNREMEGGIFPDQFEAADWLVARSAGNVTVLLPGDTWDAAAGATETSDAAAGFRSRDRWSYLKDYAERRQPYLESELARHPVDPGRSLWEPFRAYFEGLLTLSPYFNARIGMRVGFDITGPGGGGWAVDFRPGREGVYEGLDDCQYICRFASRWLVPILDGTVKWEDFFLSLRFEAHRDPDVHNEHLLGLLKFADADALAAVERYEASAGSGERILVSHEGRTWSLPRYCPHAGADLKEMSEVLPGGVLRCLGHYYEFDLASGECLNGRCDRLDSLPVTDGAQGNHLLI